MRRLLMLIPTATYRAGAFVRAAQRLDIDITMASEKRNSLSEYHPVSLAVVDLSDPRGAAAKMKTFADAHPIHAVIGVDDGATLPAAAIAEALSLTHNPPEAVYATMNKHTMRQRFEKAGVPSPDYRAISVDDDPQRVAGELSYPSVLKPLMMAASRGVIRVDSPDNFVDAFRRVSQIISRPDAPDDEEARGHILVERYVPGWEVSVEGMLTGGRLDVTAIFDKPDPLDGPYFPETIYVTPSRLPAERQERLRSLTQHGVQALGLTDGPIHAELRGTDEEMWFIEIAARSIGGYCSRVLRFEGGLTLEDLIVRHSLGLQFGVPPREKSAAAVMMLQSPRSGTLKDVKGLGSAEAVEHIDEVIISAHVGQELSPLPEGFLYLGFIFARADSPQAAESAVREAFSKLEFAIHPSR